MAASSEFSPLPPGPRRRGRANPTEGRRPRRLSRGAILAAALAIIDTEGLDALTMRRVADELATGPASLYAHVADKDEMVEAVLDQVIGEIPLPAEVDPQRWQEQLKEICRDGRRVYRRHGDLARAGLGTIPTGENAMRLAEKVLAIMRAGGVGVQVAAHSVDILGLYLTATAFEESIEANVGIKVDHDEHYHEKLRAFWQGLPADQFPYLSSMAVALTNGDGDERFDFGLDLLIRGIASAAAEPDPAVPAAG